MVFPIILQRRELRCHLTLSHLVSLSLPLTKVALSLFISLTSAFSLLRLKSTFTRQRLSCLCSALCVDCLTSEGVETPGPAQRLARAWRVGNAEASRQLIGILQSFLAVIKGGLWPARSLLQNGTLYSWWKCLDRWHTFPCRNDKLC